MPVVQVNIEVPLDIYTGLLTGKYSRVGSVVREGGKIIKHLDEAFASEQSGAIEKIKMPMSFKDIASQKNILIGIGIVTATVIIGTITYHAVKASENQKRDMGQMPQCAVDFNNSLCIYLDALQTGNLDMDIVDKLIADLDAINGSQEHGDINIDFTPGRLAALVDLITNYTIKLAEANLHELNELEYVASDSKSSSLNDLRHYLEVQKHIFENAA